MNTQLTTATPVEATALALRRLKGMGILRIVFGLIWAVEAWFKWQPDFILHTQLRELPFRHTRWSACSRTGLD
jgi:hypothetical protein